MTVLRLGMQFRLTVLGFALIAVVSCRGAGARAPARQLLRQPPPSVAISDDRVEVRYVLDQAEIPTVQERELGARRGASPPSSTRSDAVSSSPSTAAASRCAPPARPRLQLPAPAPADSSTTRLELSLSARGSRTRSSVRSSDDTFPDRVGWKAIVAAPGEGTGRAHLARRAAIPTQRPAPLSERPSRQSGRPSRRDASR